MPGLEFLAEQIEEEVEPDEFVAIDYKGKEHGYRRQVFLIASDRSAWKEMLRLWARYKRGDAFPRGFAQFRHLFERLRDLRQWEDRDRLEVAGAAEVWERELREPWRRAGLIRSRAVVESGCSASSSECRRA